jgi:hypothetical protein
MINTVLWQRHVLFRRVRSVRRAELPQYCINHDDVILLMISTKKKM